MDPVFPPDSEEVFPSSAWPRLAVGQRLMSEITRVLLHLCQKLVSFQVHFLRGPSTRVCATGNVFTNKAKRFNYIQLYKFIYHKKIDQVTHIFLSFLSSHLLGNISKPTCFLFLYYFILVTYSFSPLVTYFFKNITRNIDMKNTNSLCYTKIHYY